jgi:DNA modification methylase
MKDFAAIDFETANSERSSVCSVGIVIVRDGEIMDSYYSLIKPEPEYYSYWNTQVHGLTMEDTMNARVFPEVWAESEGKVYHPTQKPIELGRYFVRTYTNPGDVVLDNTSGSGSFLVAALMEGRNFIGIEKNENVALFKKEDIDYIKITKLRLYEVLKNLKQDKKELLKKINLLKKL